MADALQKMEDALRAHNLATPETPVLLMVSGGSDSCALAYLAADLRAKGTLGPLALLHVNHKLRGASSDRDAAFVRTLANLLDIPCFLCEVDVKRLVENGGNLEAIARRERFSAADDALRSLCAHCGVPQEHGVIFTAHTADDRVENFYMRSIVGTGPGGFRSLAWRTGNVAHPLLCCGRQELRDFITNRAEGDAPVLADEGALWREDATNACTDQFRAYVRHEIVPRAKERNPRLLETLGRTMDLIADEDDFMAGLAQNALEADVAWTSENPGQTPEYDAGCLMAPTCGTRPLVVRRRLVFRLLQLMLGPDTRVENASVQAVLDAWNATGAPIGGYVANIQGNLAVSANKRGVRIEPMAAFRARRKK